jgi:delta14-sterol reductase
MTDLAAGFFAPWIVFAGILGLHLLLPARRVPGYARDGRSGEPLRYRLNGLLVFAVAVGVWFAAGWNGVLPWDWLYEHRWPGAAGALTLGLLMSAAAVLTAPAPGNPLLRDLFFGRRVNPQLFGGRADAKMFLYLAGAVLLELNLLSFAAHHFLTRPENPSPGVVLYVVLFTWFVCDYLVFERVHLYTYDFVAERLGFKLVWGCLCWYPYFYVVGLWSVAGLPNPEAPAWTAVLAGALFLAGWTLSRGSNLQKFAFKRDPVRPFLGLAPRVIGDGERRLLASGFWGVSRHVNYLGEILMAAGLALALGWPRMIGPWLYPLYYVALLVPRERDDDRRCAAKYGSLWREYREQVPWRIVPGIY